MFPPPIRSAVFNAVGTELDGEGVTDTGTELDGEAVAKKSASVLIWEQSS
jgi:hypothetical protein